MTVSSLRVVCKRLLKSTLAVSIFRYAQSAHFRTGEALLVATQYQLTHAEVDRLLRKNENSKSLQTFVQSYDYNHLPANSPCEDQHAEGYCRLDNSYFFGVFDGHAGPQCAKAVAGRLYDYLAVSILPENVLKEIYCGADFSLVDILETSQRLLTDDKTKQRHANNIRNFASNYLQEGSTTK
uniref:PPM-type phosphatase domain-containing protein n=1 Tax=Trichuris muris TaxID=70415 RepID=A0A5S6QBH3_TRIMR